MSGNYVIFKIAFAIVYLIKQMVAYSELTETI